MNTHTRPLTSQMSRLVEVDAPDELMLDEAVANCAATAHPLAGYDDTCAHCLRGIVTDVDADETSVTFDRLLCPKCLAQSKQQGLCPQCWRTPTMHQ